ncbi:transporter [bacterium]|nr:transporter [bacterium]
MNIRSIIVRTVLAAILPLASSPAIAQNIITDRPDFTESTETVGSRTVQLETGYTYTGDSGGTHTLGEVLVRYGVIGDLELRFILPSYQIQSDVSGFSDSGIGFKYAISKGKTGIPDLSVIFETSLPTGETGFRDSDPQITTKLCMGWEIDDRLSGASNLNFGWAGSGDERFTQIAATLSFGYSLSDSTGMYTEYYGFFPNQKLGNNGHLINMGLTYLVNPNFQLDIRIGKSITDSSWFIGTGVAFRGNL